MVNQVNSAPTLVPASPQVVHLPSSQTDFWDDFLKVGISSSTQIVYSRAIADFCRRIYQCQVSTPILSQFLSLPQAEAVYQLLHYRQLLIAAKLAPSTINVRISALKSLVEYARKLERCTFSLEDVKGLKVETYRDTTGISISEFKDTIVLPDRTTTIGIRNYAILRLLWDNALRRNEICSLDLGDFDKSGRLWILGKGKIQKSPIDLAATTASAIGEWLVVRGNAQPEEPLYCRTSTVGFPDRSAPLFISLDRRSRGHRLDGSSIYRLVRKFSAAAGIDKVISPHRIRHSAITAYLDTSGGNIRAAQGLSRHANLNTLTRYDDNRHKYQAQASNVLADLV
jgi:integrase/recombinase XerC